MRNVLIHTALLTEITLIKTLILPLLKCIALHVSRLLMYSFYFLPTVGILWLNNVNKYLIINLVCSLDTLYRMFHVCVLSMSARADGYGGRDVPQFISYGSGVS